MHKAILVFEHTWYDYDGESNRTDTVVPNASNDSILQTLITNECVKHVTTSYGDFGLMTHKCVLKSTDTFETK